MKITMAVGALVLAATLPLVAQETIVPAQSKVYVAPADGYETYMIAALAKKKTPVLVVRDKESADFEIGAVSESSKAGITRTILFGQIGTDEKASFTVTNLQTNVVAFAYSVNKKGSARGKQSSAKAFAKHLKEKIEKRR